MGALSWGEPSPPNPSGCNSGRPSGFRLWWCRETLLQAARRGEVGRVKKCPLTATSSPPVALGVPLRGGAVGTPRLSGHFHPEMPLLGTGPRSSSRGRLSGPAPPRAGAAGMFSPPRGAASCPPCWKPIPVTDSGPLRSGGGRVSRGTRRRGAGCSGSPPAVALPPCTAGAPPARGPPPPVAGRVV